MKKVMIIGVPTSGKTTILKLLDSHSKLNVAHTDDKILDFFVNFNLNEIEKKLDKVNNSYSGRSTTEKVVKLKINKNDIINYSIPLHVYILKNYTSIHNLEILSKLKQLPSEHSSKIKKSETFDFDYCKFEKIFFNSIFENKKLNSEQYIELYYKAYFLSWNNSIDDNDKEMLIFQGPNNFNSAQYVLNENFDIKIIFNNRDDYSRIISNSFRIQRILKNKNIIQIVLSDLANNFSKNKRVYLEKKMHDLSNSFRNKIFNTSFNKITFETKLEMGKISKWLGLKFENSLIKPSLGGELVDQDYINRSIDMENFNNRELNVLLSYYCKKIKTLEFMKNLNIKLLNLYIKYLIRKLFKIIKLFN